MSRSKAFQDAKTTSELQQGNPVKPDASLIETTKSTPHPSITIQPVTPAHIPQLKSITGTLLQIRYPDSFFNTITTDPITASISRVAIYQPIHLPSATSPPAPIVVGAIRCRLEPLPSSASILLSKPQHQIYIQALQLLAPYRGRGVAASLLQAILTHENIQEHNVDSVYAHVWEGNPDALEWYRKRNFRVDGEERGSGEANVIQGYYRKLRPSGAWLVRLPVQAQGFEDLQGFQQDNI